MVKNMRLVRACLAQDDIRSLREHVDVKGVVHDFQLEIANLEKVVPFLL